jgi:hypothetical protein
MNKAFVREPDLTDPLCPQCGSTGEAVEWETVVSLVQAEVLNPTAPITRDAPYYCPLAACAVVYFDSLGRAISKGFLKQPAYPKDQESPICPCFGLTTEDIERDLEEGAPTRTRAAVKRAASDEADCLHKNLTGRSCASDVQRFYVRHQSTKS